MVFPCFVRFVIFKILKGKAVVSGAKRGTDQWSVRNPRPDFECSIDDTLLWTAQILITDGHRRCAPLTTDHRPLTTFLFASSTFVVYMPH
jgi:hypothetical protein